MKHSDIPMRNNDAKQIREIRKILRGNTPETVQNTLLEFSSIVHNAMMVGFCMFLAGLMLIGSCKLAHAYTDEQYANAIKKAEGTWSYGIKSISCSTEIECRRICVHTIKNNKRRFKEYGYQNYPTFISFLGSRYTPINAGNDPQGLNRNWIKNVNYFLREGL